MMMETAKSIWRTFEQKGCAETLDGLRVWHERQHAAEPLRHSVNTAALLQAMTCQYMREMPGTEYEGVQHA